MATFRVGQRVQAQAESLKYAPLREAVAEIIQDETAAIDKRLEEIRHHEDCLFNALQDMSRERPVKRNPYHDYEQAFAWAEANAQKHYAALCKVEGYVMPAYLREAYDNAMGGE